MGKKTPTTKSDAQENDDDGKINDDAMKQKRKTKLNESENENEKNETRTRGVVTAQGRLTRGGTNKTRTKSTFSPPPHKT
jgi:hypothetical protein